MLPVSQVDSFLPMLFLSSRFTKDIPSALCGILRAASVEAPLKVIPWNDTTCVINQMSCHCAHPIKVSVNWVPKWICKSLVTSFSIFLTLRILTFLAACIYEKKVHVYKIKNNKQLLFPPLRLHYQRSLSLSQFSTYHNSPTH